MKIKQNLSTIGAVATSFASSLCCILPLSAIILGLGAFGAASFFNPLRPYLLAVAFASLAFSFYRAYVRDSACAEVEICGARSVNKMNRIFFWAGALLVFVFSLAPYYGGYLVAAAIQPSRPVGETVVAAADTQANKAVVIAVEGMTCEGCAVQINETLKKFNGIVSAEASYQNKNVSVVYNPRQITLEQIKNAINDIGYKAK